MEAIKSYSDLQQSKKLAEILTFESADMTYYRVKTDWRNNPVDSKWGKPVNMLREELALPASNFTAYEYLPCWSLAALLNGLPEYNLQRTDWGNKTEYKIVVTIDDETFASKNYCNPVDACVAMIEKLHELKMM